MRKWFIGVLLLTAVLSGGCGGGKNSVSQPGLGNMGQTDTVPEPAKKSIAQYFDALAKQDFETAYQMLSDNYRKGTLPSDLASNRIKSAKVKEVKLIAAAQGPVNSARFEVTVEVEVSGPSPWQSGINVRQFVLTQYDGVWKIDDITSSS